MQVGSIFVVFICFSLPRRLATTSNMLGSLGLRLLFLCGKTWLVLLVALSSSFWHYLKIIILNNSITNQQFYIMFIFIYKQLRSIGEVFRKCVFSQRNNDVETNRLDFFESRQEWTRSENRTRRIAQRSEGQSFVENDKLSKKS